MNKAVEMAMATVAPTIHQRDGHCLTCSGAWILTIASGREPQTIARQGALGGRGAKTSAIGIVTGAGSEMGGVCWARCRLGCVSDGDNVIAIGSPAKRAKRHSIARATCVAV